MRARNKAGATTAQKRIHDSPQAGLGIALADLQHPDAVQERRSDASEQQAKCIPEADPKHPDADLEQLSSSSSQPASHRQKLP